MFKALFKPRARPHLLLSLFSLALLASAPVMSPIIPAAPALAADSVPDITGTVWSGKDSDGDFYSFTFLKGGQVRFESDSSGERKTYEDAGDIWAQNGAHVVILLSDYSTYRGTLAPDGQSISGKSWNLAGQRWTWTFKRQP